MSDAKRAWKISLAKPGADRPLLLRHARTASHIKAIDFAARVLNQQKEGYQLAFLELDGVIRSVAGFRILNLLFSGRTLYVDDLVTRDSDRSRGFGAALFDWLVEYAKEQACEHLTLDSGVQRFAAHRFYLNRGMDITSHHFQLKLNSPP